MLSQFKDYIPVIEIAVLKSMGEAGASGSRDVLIKVESLSSELNPVVKSVSIEKIENVNLSLKLSGFDFYEMSEPDDDQDFKILDGTVEIIATLNNGSEKRNYILHEPKIRVDSVNGNFPAIGEVKSIVERAWFNSFAEALSDIIDQTTVITGNISQDNPYNLDAEEITSSVEPVTKERKLSSNKLSFWIAVISIAVIVFILTAGTKIYNGISGNNSGNQTNQELSLTNDTESQTYQEPSLINSEGSQTYQEPTLIDNAADEQATIETEILDEFGLESNVSLD